MAFKTNDVVICLSMDGEELLTGIVESDEVFTFNDPPQVGHTYVSLRSFYDEEWHPGPGAWEFEQVKLHPDPDSVWASYTAWLLTQ